MANVHLSAGKVSRLDNIVNLRAKRAISPSGAKREDRQNFPPRLLEPRGLASGPIKGQR